jgi:3-oxoacyl-[acyl-carrier protein] reductase
MSIEIDHSGRAALVTGAGAGIGREIARWMARAGAAVAVNDVRPERAGAVVAEIEAEGGKAVAVPADCRDDAQVDVMVATPRSCSGASTSPSTTSATCPRGGA